MGRFIILSFLFLGWAFYQLSGGSSFDPEATRLSRVDGPSASDAVGVSNATVAVAEAPEIKTEPITLELATVEEVLKPQKRLQTRPARVTEARLEQASLEVEEQQQIILPSLIENAVPSEDGIRPVDFSSNAPAAAPVASLDRRVVTGSRVNVRGGPGTDFQVVNSLVRGAEVEVLEDPGNGWVRMRPVGGGPAGWMADFLLTSG